MNVGYQNLNKINSSELFEKNCPVCGNNIYVSKHGIDFACTDINCPLGHGVSKIISNIDEIKAILQLI